jgi:hypothetical protein
MERLTTSAPGPDIVPLAATVTNDGIANILFVRPAP